MRSWVHLLLCLAITVVTSGASPSRARAAVDSDVPGVPLSESGIVRDVIGGSIVDRVYSIVVPAASVLVATVRGEPGAELGLYAFGQGAESILTSLPLVSSAKPGGVQSISMRFIRAGTVYLDINGRNADRTYLFLLRVSILIDNTPPIISSVRVSDRSTSGNVCVTVRSSDPISGITDIALSEDSDANAALWSSFSGSGIHCASVGAGDGLRTLRLWTRNGIGLISLPFKFVTYIDDTPPALVASVPSDSLILSSDQRVSWRFAEPVRTVEPVAKSVSVFNQAGQYIPGLVTRNASLTKIIWTPSTRVPIGSVLMASLGGVRDLAGNTLEFTETRVMYRKRSTWIKLTIPQRSSRPLLSVVVPRYLIGEDVSIEMKLARGWSVIRRLTLEDRRFSTRIEVEPGATVRLVYSGSDRFAPSRSGKVTLPK